MNISISRSEFRFARINSKCTTAPNHNQCTDTYVVSPTFSPIHSNVLDKLMGMKFDSIEWTFGVFVLCARGIAARGVYKMSYRTTSLFATVSAVGGARIQHLLHTISFFSCFQRKAFTSIAPLSCSTLCTLLSPSLLPLSNERIYAKYFLQK